ncbi:BTB and MATH domain-containing protein 36-like [Haliotis rufescens]|uniref:BTB and MATH domain-containing protein 36-like n=1 Tax=Haliotis rufescens TaxID=6454 RepID=UPI00201EBF0D|nr:BTB and MATH domain-containing protein 36-like [Haliotis rufescens]XP_048258810.1 BTB and MATH domain-containing protein 36-like [Haliotis rufescens]
MEKSKNMFSEACLTSDVALVVEGKKLHVNKTVLSLASPVFEKMFFGEFKEKTLLEVPLPGKTYDDMVQLLLCIYPSTTNPITADNIDALLPLAEEYVMTSLKQRCRTFVTTYLKLNVKTLSKSQLVHFMHLADKYDFDDVLEDCLTQAVYIEYSDVNGLQHQEGFQDLCDKTAVQFFKRRLVLVEGLVRPVLESSTTASGNLQEDFQTIISGKCNEFSHRHARHECRECKAVCCGRCRNLGTEAMEDLAHVIKNMLPAFKESEM